MAASIPPPAPLAIRHPASNRYSPQTIDNRFATDVASNAVIAQRRDGSLATIAAVTSEAIPNATSSSEASSPASPVSTCQALDHGAEEERTGVDGQVGRRNGGRRADYGSRHTTGRIGQVVSQGIEDRRSLSGVQAPSGVARTKQTRFRFTSALFASKAVERALRPALMPVPCERRNSRRAGVPVLHP